LALDYILENDLIKEEFLIVYIISSISYLTEQFI